MGITLNVTVSTPLSEEDAQVLTGVAMLSMTVANGTLAPGPMGSACGKQHPSNDDAFCVRTDGHDGRHRYQDLGPAPASGMH